MANRFTVRVELHDADGDDYEELHTYMEEEGFVRYIVTTNNVKLQLPTAEYSIQIAGDKDDVLGKAKTAAARTYKNYMVLVTASAGRTWANLPVWKS